VATPSGTRQGGGVARALAVSTPELDAALWLASHERLSVFPCCPDKKPATRHGFHQATTDPKRIRRFFWAGRLIGVPTGKVSGFVILDIDPRHGGHVWEADNVRQLRRGGAPITRIHNTQSGGRHYLFAYSGEELRNSSGKIADGVDVRADGGYCIWWPLHGFEPLHPLKMEHLAPWPRWLDALAPKPAPPQELYIPPEGDAGAMTRHREHATETLKFAVRRVARAREGVRNDTLNNMTHLVADYVVSGGLSVEEVMYAMRLAARAAGEEEGKIVPTIKSALKSRGVPV
jgi:hypothetical protein